ncbi:MAG: hypothetical protein E7244_11430 [Enterocloster citroniae]|nr:hypothetical protein [Enterocloster citroniae]
MFNNRVILLAQMTGVFTAFSERGISSGGLMESAEPPSIKRGIWTQNSLVPGSKTTGTGGYDRGVSGV